MSRLPQFRGYAAVFGTPDRDNDTFERDCFQEFLKDPNHLNIPMLNGHDPHLIVGRWLQMEEDNLGLKVTGELTHILQGIEHGGLSVMGKFGTLPTPNLWGGRTFKICYLHEISVLLNPRHPHARFTEWF